LLSFSFRRDRYNVGAIPDWPNVELGKSTERRLVSRALMVCDAVRIIFRRRHVWRDASMVYARNLDLALLAAVGQSITRSQAPLVYEVLDIHPLLTRNNLRGSLLRWVERRLLSRCRLLVVSSPAYIREYFAVRQKYCGPTFLLENKWSRASFDCDRRTLPYELAKPQPVWTIGWFGNLRCERSLNILTDLAEQLPERVRIVMRGCASLLPRDSITQAIRNRPNMHFVGEYSAPEDLPAIYTQVHFNWCADFSDGVNSLWLLPNRLYEGGFFGVPAIGIAEHETGRVINERGLGVSLGAPYVDNLKRLLMNMTCDAYEQLRGKLEALPAEYFVETSDTARCMIERMAAT
jgi:succinoglycan biosynthesis protein ExoL